jgi:hypothetical protein
MNVQRFDCLRWRDFENGAVLAEIRSGLRNLERHRITVQTLQIIAKEIERHCPCGARPESLNTHPHVCGCPVERLLVSIKLCQDLDKNC